MCGKKLNAVIFSDCMNLTNVKLCMMVGLTELYQFTTLSVTWIIFEGHSSVSDNCKFYVETFYDG